MFTSTSSPYTRQRAASTVAAVLVVAFAGLVFNHGHEGALPAGVIEVGELTPVGLERLAIVTLPGIEVVGRRELQVAVTLPEIEIVGTRERLLAGDPSTGAQGPRG
jgi:hypothetical protein